MCDNLLSLNIKQLLKRVIRLLIPYIGWSIIILKINNFFNKKYNTKFTDSYEELKIQILWGLSILVSMESDFDNYYYFYNHIYFSKICFICFIYIINIILFCSIF